MKKALLLFALITCFVLLSNLYAGCRKDSLYSYEFDNTNKLIRNRIIYNYDNSGLISQTLQYLDNGQWINLTKDIYTNNTRGMLLNSVHQEWVQWNKQWRNQRQISNTYNADLKKTHELVNDWDTLNNVWVNVNETNRGVSVKGRDSLFIVRYWKNSQWNNEQKIEFTYQTDTLRQQIYYNWNGADWGPVQRTLYTYSGGLLSQETRQSRQGSQWADLNRILYTYKNNVLSGTLEQNMNGSTWVNSQSNTYTYDGSKCLNKIDHLYNWDENDSTWTYHTQDSFFQVQTVGTSNISAGRSTLVYPNPCHALLHIETPVPGTYQIMDIAGRMIQTGELKSEDNEVNISALAPGIYILRYGNSVHSIKVE